MGTRLGPSYACLFMSDFEQKLLDSYTGSKPSTILRYIDDYIGIAPMQLSELHTFIDYADSFHPSIKLSHTVGQSVNFLDCTFTILGTNVTSTIFYKDTDTHSYLHYHSSHSSKCKESIPYSQFLRLRKICSDPGDFEKKAKEMSDFFLAHHYPDSLVSTALQQAKTKSRTELLYTSNSDQTNTRIPLVLTYHPANFAIKNILYRNYSILQEDPDLQPLFPQKPLLAYRREKNIKDMLVKSTVKPTSDDVIGTFTCGRNRCITCQHVSQDTLIRGPKSTFVVKGHYSCITSNVIYCIKCSVCQELYIGETSRRLGDRFREHVYNARKKLFKSGEVSKHFNQTGHSFTDMEILVMLQITDTSTRKKMEEHFIYKLGTLDPCGLNELCNLNK
jgi:hypothetical protein